MNRDFHEFCQTCNLCQQTNNLLAQNMAQLITISFKEPIQKWGLDFNIPIKSTNCYYGNWYILRLPLIMLPSGRRQKLCTPTQFMVLQNSYMTTFSPSLVVHWPLLPIKVHISLTMLFIVYLIILYWNILALPSIIHKGIDKLSLVTKFCDTLLQN
jgi:hypothetical protein